MWGNFRSYKIDLQVTSVQLLDDQVVNWMPAAQWTKYNIAVTQLKEVPIEAKSGRGWYEISLSVLARILCRLTFPKIFNATLVPEVGLGIQFMFAFVS
jgi:hypothetical protein